ncbi:hypothetical protein FRC03_011491 [Tulasnella sp. 419]|nr:hypothetical protein FRC03_011491 [Tulasnella sp. 419]
MATTYVEAEGLQTLIQKLMQENAVLRRENMSLRNEIARCTSQDRTQKCPRYRDSDTSLVPIRDYKRWSAPARSSRLEPSLPVITRVSGHSTIATIPATQSPASPPVSNTSPSSKTQVVITEKQESPRTQDIHDPHPTGQVTRSSESDQQGHHGVPLEVASPIPEKEATPRSSRQSLRPPVPPRSPLRPNTCSTYIQSSERKLPRIVESTSLSSIATADEQVVLASATNSSVANNLSGSTSNGETSQHFGDTGIEGSISVHGNEESSVQLEEIAPLNASKSKSLSSFPIDASAVTPAIPPVGPTVSGTIVEESSFEGGSSAPKDTHFEDAIPYGATSHYPPLGSPPEASDVHTPISWGDCRNSNIKTWHRLTPSSPALSVDKQKGSSSASDAGFDWQSDYHDQSPTSTFSSSDASYFTLDTSVPSTPMTEPGSHWSDYSSSDGRTSHKWLEGVSTLVGKAKRSYGKIKKIIPGLLHIKRSSKHSDTVDHDEPISVIVESAESVPGVAQMFDAFQNMEPHLPTNHQFLPFDFYPPYSAIKTAATCGSRFVEHIDSQIASASSVGPELTKDDGFNDDQEEVGSFLPAPSPATWFSGRI